MRTIRRYLLREIVAVFSLSVVIITILFLSQRIIQLTDWALNRGVGAAEVMELLVYLLPAVMLIIIPMVTLFSILLAVGRWSADMEIVALKAVGVSLYRLMGPILLFAAFAAGLALFFSQVLTPAAARGSRNVRYRIVRTKTEAAVSERLFVSLLSQVTVYIQNKESDGELKGMMVAMEYWPDDSDWVLRQFAVARSGRFIHDPIRLDNELWLFDGTLIQEDRNTGRHDLATFTTCRLRLDLGRLKLGEDEQRQQLDLAGLTDEIARLRPKAAAGRKDDVEDLRALLILWHERFAFPVGCLALGFWALPLGIQPPRAGRARAIVLSAMLSGCFYYAMILAKFAALHAWTQPGLAIWAPDCAILLSGLYMLRQKNLERPIFLLSWIEDTFYYLYDRIKARLAKPGADVDSPGGK
jgi:lipopolysaccharide export system permease protein